MKRIYEVTFNYRDLSAPRDVLLDTLTSKFVRKKMTFGDQNAISEYAEQHKTMTHRGKTLTLVYYYVDQYVLCKEKEYSVNMKHE